MICSSIMNEFVLSIENLTKKYGEKKAVDNLTLHIKRGVFYGLLGPNGAGKSTTINCITGIGNITSGRILVDGIDVQESYKEARTRVGLSPQEFNVDIFATPTELLDYMGGYYGIPKAIRTERTQALFKRFDLIEHAHKKFKELSGGLKRRVILARALIHNPVLLILDEPTAGVDVKQRHDLWAYLKELNEAGTTIILTSHYLEEVEMLCSEVAIINNGTIVAEGTKDSFIADGSSLEKKYLDITHGSAY